MRRRRGFRFLIARAPFVGSDASGGAAPALDQVSANPGPWRSAAIAEPQVGCGQVIQFAPPALAPVAQPKGVRSQTSWHLEPAHASVRMRAALTLPPVRVPG